MIFYHKTHLQHFYKNVKFHAKECSRPAGQKNLSFLYIVLQMGRIVPGGRGEGGSRQGGQSFTIWPGRWHQITPTQKHSGPLNNIDPLSLSLAKYFYFQSKLTSNYSNTKTTYKPSEQHTATIFLKYCQVLILNFAFC